MKVINLAGNVENGQFSGGQAVTGSNPLRVAEELPWQFSREVGRLRPRRRSKGWTSD